MYVKQAHFAVKDQNTKTRKVQGKLARKQYMYYKTETITHFIVIFNFRHKFGQIDVEMF